MVWAKFNRLVNSIVLAMTLVAATGGGVYYMGYPWNCNQAIQKRSEATLRLREAREGNYPPSSPYRQYRESTKREADAVVVQKCEQESSSSSSKRSTKFFLKDRSDY
ncbi:MAG: hypothetical protein AAGD25_16310 [Cyanobacteria bacterium P01_F01_bin.150]